MVSPSMRLWDGSDGAAAAKSGRDLLQTHNSNNDHRSRLGYSHTVVTSPLTSDADDMLRPTALPRSLRTASTQVRGLATVADTPVRHYGGLKDQDRIFTNLFTREDWGEAPCRLARTLRKQQQATNTSQESRVPRPAATGTRRRTSSSRVTRGSSRP